MYYNVNLFPGGWYYYISMSLIFITKTIAQLFAHVQSVCIPHQSKLERGLIVINRKLGSAQLVCCWDGLLKLASLALCGSLLECHSRLEIWILGPTHEKSYFWGRSPWWQLSLQSICGYMLYSTYILDSTYPRRRTRLSSAAGSIYLYYIMQSLCRWLDMKNELEILFFSLNVSVSAWTPQDGYVLFWVQFSSTFDWLRNFCKFKKLWT